jgi:pyrimidine operon attenuation protein / uracil phosphoribosyltransferase
MASSTEKVVLQTEDVRRVLVRVAHEIVERNPGPQTPVLIGIHRRGAFLAQRLRVQLEALLDAEVPLGDLDIGFYRDDLQRRADAPVVHASHIDFDVAGRTVVIVDDVLFTGRTARAAIEALFDYGRPARVQLAVLADRGHRELPIRPDYVGKNLPTSREEHVHVRVEELDGVDEVTIALGTHGGAGSASSVARVHSHATLPASLPSLPCVPRGGVA